MIQTLMFVGKKPDFNQYFQIYNKEIDELKSNGLQICNTKFEIDIHAVIADAPARAKITMSKQFNAKYGCLHCIQTSELLRPRKRIFKYDQNMVIRTPEMYKEQVEIVTNNLDSECEGNYIIIYRQHYSKYCLYKV